MPRSKKKNPLPVVKRMNLQAELDRRLSSVVETAKKQKKSKRISVIPSAVEGSLDQKGISPRASLGRNDDSTESDRILVRSLSAASPAKGPKQVRIRYESHSASAHLVRIGGLARRHIAQERERVLEGVGDWLAPYEQPPSIETLAAHASDLVLDPVDPYLFAEQFTAHDADVAYGQRYGFWFRLREPFIRWEARPRTGSSIERLEERVASAARRLKDTEEEIIAEAETAWDVPVLVPRLVPWRVVAGLMSLLIVVSLPAGAVSLARSVSRSWSGVRTAGALAIADVKSALTAEDAAAADAWRAVSDDLQASDRALNEANALAVALSKAIPQTRHFYDSARGLVRAGDKAATAAAALSKGLARAMEEPARYPIDRLHLFKTYVDAAAPELDEAVVSVGRVRTDGLPDDLRAQVEEVRGLLETAQTSLRDIQAIQNLMLSVLGDAQARRYLLVFQNPSELRPTGGFMGSFADVIVDRGEMRSVTVPGGGPYDLRSQLKARVAPPEPMRLIASRWEFQDANWFPDFPAAAQKIRWFWSQSGQPTIDGVVAVNADMVVRLLEITGPIDMPEYGKTITAENFMLEAQKAVELEYDREENKPKKFIGDLMPLILGRLKHGGRDTWLAVMRVAVESLERKDIQIALFDPNEQEVVERFGWSGSFKPSPGDALAVVDTNIAGQKSDAVIDEHVLLDSQIAGDGSIVNTVTITRTHNGEKGELFRGVNNVTYLRVYVPEGSELISAEGLNPPPANLFKKVEPYDVPDADLAAIERRPRTGPNGVRVTDEFGRTAFGAWVQVEPGETQVTRFRYRLPMRASDIARRIAAEAGTTPADGAYMLLLTSQSGKAGRTIETRVHYPESWRMTWANLETSKLDLTDAWDRDRVVAGLFDHDATPNP